MIFLQKNVWFRFFSLVLVVFCVSTFLALATRPATSPSLSDDADAPLGDSPLTVVIDAGHGGEDGGAVSASGIVEKEINLSIANLLCDLLKEKGVNVVMTRTTDTLLYDKSVDYQGRKKKLDLEARRQIAESIDDCIFVSIHLNSFPQEQYRGLQVWYSQNDARSQSLAEEIRNTVQEALQPKNDRACKPATSSIYLLHRLQMPAVLVECGFLSNREEAELLADRDYQTKLAARIAEAILAFLVSSS